MAEVASGNENGPDRYDVFRYGDGTYHSVPAGTGEEIIAAHESEARKRRWIASVAAGIVVFVIVVIGSSWALGGTRVPAGILVWLTVVTTLATAAFSRSLHTTT